MNARLGLILILIVGLAACGDPTTSDPAKTETPEAPAIDMSAVGTVEECHADAVTRAHALADHVMMKPIADAIAGSLDDMDPAENGIAGLTASKAPLPIEEAQAIAGRIAARVRVLEESATALAGTAETLEGEAADATRETSRSLVCLAASMRREHAAFAAAKIHVANADNLKESDVTMRGDEGARGRFDDARLYHGDSSWCESPAQVDVNAVYRRIPEYREIKEKRIKKDGPRYYFLLIEAGKKFRKALRVVASRRGYDVIGGLGAIQFPDRDVPVITDEVIAALP